GQQAPEGRAAGATPRSGSAPRLSGGSPFGGSGADDKPSISPSEPPPPNPPRKAALRGRFAVLGKVQARAPPRRQRPDAKTSEAVLAGGELMRRAIGEANRAPALSQPPRQPPLMKHEG